MLVLDLQWVLFALLFAVVVAGGGLALVLRRTSARPPSDPGPLDAATLHLLEDAPFGALVLVAGRLVYANQEAREMLHLGGDRPLDGQATELAYRDSGVPLPAADWADLLREDIATARHKVKSADVGVSDAIEGRLRTVTFATGRTVRWWVSPHSTQDVVIIEDVTGERRAQRAGRTLLSDLGHELRTPIATLLTHLEIMELDDVGEDIRRQSLHLSRREAQRMSRLVNDMLELGRLETVETLVRRPLDVASLVQEVVLQETPRARGMGVSLDIVASSSLPLVPANADRLRQVFLNLLDNALKYAGEDAKVTVSLERGKSGVACAICDTGPGIPPEHLPYVTQRFYRVAPESVEGSGLGLSLVQEVLRLHGSELVVESPVLDGRGTCTRFTLPSVGEEGQGVR